MGDTSGNTFLRYSLAVAAVVLAVVLRLLLDPLLNERLPFITLFAAVAFMAWYGGRGPALFALALGLLGVAVFVLKPRFSLGIEHHEDVFGLLFYAAISAGCIALFEQLRAARSRAERSSVEVRQQYDQLRQESQRRQKAEATVAEEGERLRVTLASIGDGVITTDADGRVAFLNDVAQQLTGWVQQDAEGVPLEQVFQIVNETTRQPVENPALRSLREGKVVGLANHTVLISKDGRERPIDDSAAPIRDHQGHIFGSVLVFRDITERKEAETALNERVRLLSLNAAVGNALVQGNGLRAMLRQCSESLVKHLDGAFARIWTLNEVEKVLELRASAGLYTHLDGPHSRVPVGQYKIGLIAQERKPHLTNAVVGDPRVSDQDWAQREGMIAFAGYPLIVDDRLVGVMAMFARQPLSEATLEAMASVADEIAVGIERKTAQDRLHEQREWLRVMLASIGDAVISTDTQGRVTFLNGVAADLTGWMPEEAQGQLLENVFPIRNEQTRQPVENPVEKVLREGVIVGLANHTVLVARDGSVRPIDDSAAPIRDASGQLIGVVLIFRDVTEQRRAEQELRASEARKSAVLETALDCVITMDHLGRVVEFNPSAERTFGYARGEVVGRELADLIIPPSLRERHHRGMAHYLATGEGPVLGKRLELPALRADGSEFPAELAITRISTDGPPLFTAHLRDISDRTRAEQHRNARLAVTHALNQASDVRSGASGVLRAVCESLAWDVGFFWMANGSGDRLECLQTWHNPNVLVAEFERVSCSRTFTKGEGLPGRVWATGQPAWVIDILEDGNFPRLVSAVDYGLHSALACPVVVGERLLGVIEFFTQRIREPEADLLEMMGTIAGNVGQFVERRSAEDHVRQSEAELVDFFENATVGLHWVGPDGIILRANQAELDMLGYSREEYIGRPVSDFHADEDVICDILQRLQAGEQLHEYPARLRCKDGSIRDVLIDSSVMFRNGGFVHTRCFTRDVTERRKGEAVLTSQKRVLELLVLGAPLPDVLDALCEVIEGQAQDKLIATVLLADDDGKRLRSVAGRRAPPEYARAVDCVAIGPCVGSCGTAAFRGEPVVVTDIATDPLWADFRDLALGHGLRACWSTPILSSQGKVLGTFAVYYPSPRPPSPDEQRLVEILTRTAGVAIERRRDEASLREQTATSEALYRIGRKVAEELDLHKLVQVVTDEGTRLCGAQFGAFFYKVVGERGEAYTLYTVSGEPLEAFSRFPMPRPTELFGPTFRGEGVVRLDDVMLDPRYGKSAPYHGMPEGHLPVRSYLAVPVISRTGEVLGGLFFGHPEAGVFTRWHEQLLVGVAAQAAVAIDNARLYKQTQDSEERFRQLAEHVQDVFWMADPHKPQMLYVSPAYERVWGRSRQSLYDEPRSFLEAVHPQDRERVVASLQRQVAGEPTSEEYRVVAPDGSVRWVWDRAFPIRDAEGRVYRVAGIAEDVDERKHAEDASRFLADASTALATVEDYRSTLQKVAGLAVPAFADWCAVDLVEEGGSLQRLAVVHVDADKVRLATELYRKYPPDPDEAHGAYRVLRTAEPEFVAEISDEVLAEVAQDEEHLRILRGLALRSFVCVPLRTRNKMLGVVTFVYAESGRRYEARDLTLAEELARRAAVAIENAGLYHELKEADRRKDEFLATLAHELRNPLAPIRNGLQVLRLAGQENGVVGEARSMMERQLSQMVRLVDDLLDVSRITRNKLDLKKQQVELAAVVQSAVETSHPLIDSAEHELSVTLPPKVVHVYADLTRLAQVFSNLLNNAAKYTEPRGRIELTAELQGAEVVVTVRDNGLGIPAEALPKLFQMFSQVDRNMERAQGGLGIGLTLVRRLVEMHGGTVEAHSEGPGKGSEFVVRLPALMSDAVTSGTTAMDSGPAAVSTKRRILIVDDNQDSAMSLGMMLKLLGNETRTAHDGLAAVETAEQFRPDIILLDIGLPKLNGYEACRRIREQLWSQGMVIVALTGWGQDEDRRRSHDAGFDHHLVKPVEIAALQGILQSASPL